jgi:hypothetical protein
MEDEILFYMTEFKFDDAYEMAVTRRREGKDFEPDIKEQFAVYIQGLTKEDVLTNPKYIVDKRTPMLDEMIAVRISHRRCYMKV